MPSNLVQSRRSADPVDGEPALAQAGSPSAELRLDGALCSIQLSAFSFSPRLLQGVVNTLYDYDLVSLPFAICPKAKEQR